MKIRNCCPEEPIRIVAHSHGGNVTLSALHELQSRRQQDKCENDNIDYRVDNVVLLATPHFVKTKDMKRFTAVYLSTQALSMIRGSLVNIYSNEDIVQTTLAATFPGMKDGKIYVCRDLLTLPEYSAVVESRVGPVDAHGVLHNTTMGKLIGEYLSGKVLS